MPKIPGQSTLSPKEIKEEDFMKVFKRPCNNNSYGAMLKKLIAHLQKEDFSSLPGNRRLKVNCQQRERGRDERTYFPELILRGNWLQDAGIDYDSRVCVIPINGVLVVCPEGMCIKPDVQLIGRAIVY